MAELQWVQRISPRSGASVRARASLPRRFVLRFSPAEREYRTRY
jgi:hypothetical protein